jgi:hypothetical protein
VVAVVNVAAEQDPDEVDGPCLLIQRQFEDPDEIGAISRRMTRVTFRLRRVEFTPQNLSVEFDRPADNLVSVTLAMATSDLEEASGVAKII